MNTSERRACDARTRVAIRRSVSVWMLARALLYTSALTEDFFARRGGRSPARSPLARVALDYQRRQLERSSTRFPLTVLFLLADCPVRNLLMPAVMDAYDATPEGSCASSAARRNASRSSRSSRTAFELKDVFLRSIAPASATAAAAAAAASRSSLVAARVSAAQSVALVSGAYAAMLSTEATSKPTPRARAARTSRWR